MKYEHRGAIALLLCAAWAPGTAHAQFLEPSVRVLRVLEGTQVGENFGWVGATLPDLDGDGRQDILIPAISASGGGEVTLFSGANGQVLRRAQPTAGTLFGYSVAAAGDVDDDGVDDYIIGGGQVLIYSGRSGAVLRDLTPTTGFATAVSEAGDLNRDGYDDVIVGSQFNSTSTTSAGRIFALSGRDGSTLWTRDGEAAGHQLGTALGLVGDVNRDRVPDVSAGAGGAGPSGGGEAYVLSGVDGSIIHRLEPEDPAEAVVFGVFFCSGTPDMDGDRVSDVFVGDYFEGAGPRQGTGRAYVFSGRTGRRIHLFTGFDAGDGLGPGRGIPDVNGDGRGDVIVASYLDSEGATNAGAAYIFSGRSGALLRTITSTRAGDNFGVDALSVGDVDADGLPDFVVTAVGRSFAWTEPGRAYVIAGTRLPCVADLSGDRFVGLRDLLRIRFTFGAAGGPADLNGSGLVDFDDLIVGFRDLGRCPRGRPRRGRRR